MNETILSIERLTHSFGGLKAISDFRLQVQRGQVYGVIGPNGAGKTTLFNLITGIYRPTAGRIFFDGNDITGKKPHEINRLGIARTFQNLRLFSELTVRENIVVGTLSHKQTDDRLIDELLHLVGLSRRQAEQAKNLPYGLQRKLEIARALATSPKMLLLDEPAAGMNPQEVLNLVELIRTIKERFHLTVILIEHQMRLVEAICERITVMSFGQVLAEGSVKEIQNDPTVIKAYLGEGEIG